MSSTHLDPTVLKFLSNIKKNNNKDWFALHKDQYTQCRENLITFVQELIVGISFFDAEIANIEAKKCVFRIYKDVRFSKDKNPYKTNFGAHLVAFNQKPHDRAGYYLHIEPGNCFLAGGAYMPPSPWIKAIRNEINYNAATLKEILKDKNFVTYFGKMQGDQLKTAPRDYPKDHKEIELLKYKSFLAMHPLKDSQVSDAGFLAHCLKVFKALKPFDDYLNLALES